MTEADFPIKSSERVQSLDRAFLLLERLADASSLTLSELAEGTGIPMPTAHRLLGFLAGKGYVRREAGKRYALGLRLIRFGQTASRGLATWAAPYLARLVDEFGETANMAMLEGDACMYVAQVPSPQSERMFTEVGRVVMPHCTGVGKAILSMLPEQQVVSMLTRTGMPPRTETTLTTIPDMLAALQEIRATGYAIDDGEQEFGVRCVAVPLTGLPLLAAVSVSGPSSRVRHEDVARIAPRVQAVARELVSGFTAAAGDATLAS